MEPHRGPQYRTALLPWEKQLCETLGITSQEYFEFHDLVSQHIEEERGRELIPDVRNEPVTIVTLIVGIALSAVGMLLAPKPKAPEQQERGSDFRGSDRRARSKYAPLSEFDSVQELASLGSIIPLVFANRDVSNAKNPIGGVRVESQMLWSKMRNRRTYQELHALMLFSAGTVAAKPDFDGFAFGTTKLTGYMKAKVALWFARGRFGTYEPFKPSEDNEQYYEEGTKKVGSDGTFVFKSYWPYDEKSKMVFCGVITPSQTAQFGQYSPIRNGNAWKYSFRYPGKGDGDADRKEMVRYTRQKHIAGYHAGRTNLEIRENSGGGIDDLTFTINYKQSTTVFVASSSTNSSPNINTADHFYGGGDLVMDRSGHFTREPSPDKGSFSVQSGGFKEGINSIDESKIDADITLEVGELYLMGEAVYRCTGRKNMNNKVDQGTPFEPEFTGTVEYDFEIDDEFSLSFNYNKEDLEDRVKDSVLTDGPNTIRNESQCPIQRFAYGLIGTTRQVDLVEIGFKSIVYRQMNGYTNINNFADTEMPDQFAKEGGSYELGTSTAYYDRVSLFRLQIKRGNRGGWVDWNRQRMFAIHGNNPKPLYNMIRIELPAKDFYEFRFIPFCGNSWIHRGTRKVYDGWKEYINDTSVYLLNVNQKWTEADTTRGYKISMRGEKVKLHEVFSMSHPFWATGEQGIREGKGNQTNPGSLLNDYWFFNADSVSHENQPEHEITWMNEYVDNSKEWYENQEEQYNELAYAGIVCQSSTEISSFSNFSAYFQQGIQIRKLSEAANLQSTKQGPSNNFGDIAYALLTNRRYGVGELIGENSVDATKMQVAAKFCKANGFYWDGIIAERTNVREFLFKQAGYQLLDFTIIGGRFSLVPTVPYGSNYKILNDAVAGSDAFPIKGLFTDGNVRNFKTTFLSPEERQLFTAEVKYRGEPDTNGFPDQRSMRVRLANDEGGYFRDPVEVFDMSQFCTSRKHVLTFAKYALRVRQLVDHAVSFETTPDAAHTLAPGDYIRVAVSVQHQERDRGYVGRLRTGSITPTGVVQASDTVTNGQAIYYWTPGTTEVKEGTLRLDEGRVVDTSLKGVLFTTKQDRAEARVYKIESIAFSEESFVEISATYVPLTKNTKTMRTLKWDDEDFVVEDQKDE